MYFHQYKLYIRDMSMIDANICRMTRRQALPAKGFYLTYNSFYFRIDLNFFPTCKDFHN
jgi:hypothetical protein